MPLDLSILGKGIYSPRQAARLIGGQPQEVLRWTRGSGAREPLWHAYYQDLDDTTELNFSDLIELRVVKAFRKAGISLQAIRFAIEFATERFGLERPLSTLQFKTDGREILVDALERDDCLISLSKKHPGQAVFSEIVQQSLSDLEYEAGQAIRWRPTGSKYVVLDPRRQFGTPLLEEYGISTETLSREAREHGSVSYISKIYDIPVRYVNDAIRYEEALDRSGVDG
ncbi:hypothetical protein JF540_00400 [Salipiger thiooxidans]|uniref:hypothetical protein n=1 Tax=Salipiger thiooxidans TaxID=282683 RepID=UPI001A8C93DE|nr:hypothetical protein [Salipiger thiooxidans]MBN8185148.1 hypothetical protein [Salipiger thiooxidans]